MDTFTVAFTCTCGEPAREEFLENDGSMGALLALVETAVLADVEDIRVTRHHKDGKDYDETTAVLLALVIRAL